MEVTLKERMVGPFKVIVAHFKAGDTISVHRHLSGGHLSIISNGTLIAHVTGHGDYVLEGTSTVYWPIGTEHSWEAVTDATLINVFAI